MKRGFKLFAVIFLMATFALGSASGADGARTDTEVFEMSLEDALTLAREDNSQVKLAKLSLEKAQLGKKQFNSQKRKRDEILDNPPPSTANPLDPNYIPYQEYLAMSGFDMEKEFDLLELRSKVGVDLAEKGVDAALRGVAFGVEGVYYGAIFARDNLAIAEDALKRQEDMLRIVQVQYRVGTAAKRDVMEAQVQVAKAQADLAKAQSEKEKAYMNLKELLGLGLDLEVELAYHFEFEPLENVPEVVELVAEALERRIDVAQARGALDIAQLDFDLTKKVSPSITYAYKEKEHAFLEAEINLEQTEVKAEKEIRSLLLDLQDAGENIPLLAETVAMAEESLRLAKLSYEAGMLRRVDVDAAQEGLRQVLLQQSMAISNYNLTKLKLDNVVYIATASDARY